MQSLGNDFLTDAGAIGIRRVDEVDAEFDGAEQSANRLVVGAAFPLLAADAPGAIAKLTDFETGLSKFSISHAATMIVVIRFWESATIEV